MNGRMLDAVQSIGLLSVIIIVGLVLSAASPVFFTRINIENLLFSSTIVAIVAIGQAFVILVAGIDLSVGAVEEGMRKRTMAAKRSGASSRPAAKTPPGDR